MELKKHIANCKKGDRKAQYALYRHCFDFLMPVCRRYHNNEQDAAGVFNLGFFRILQRLEQYKAEGRFEAWTRKIMVRVIIDEYRKNKKHRQGRTEWQYEENGIGHFSEINEAIHRLEAEDILVMIDKLEDPGRTVFNLFAIDGYTHREIGDMMDMSEGTSKWHVHEARKKLKRMLMSIYSLPKVEENEK